MTRSLTWITNIPTPYRIALWKSLMQRVELDVLFMADTEPNRDWDGASLSSQVRGKILNVPKVQMGHELTLYFPTVQLIRRVKAARAVIIDGWESPAYVAVALYCRVRRIPYVYFYRGTLQTQRDITVTARMRSALFRRAGAVLTAGPSSTEAVLAAGVHASRVVEGINSVDVSAFGSIAHDSTITPFHRFLYVGQLVERKNVTSLLDALAQIDSHHTLTVVGDGPLRYELQSQVAHLRLQDRVSFRGHLDSDAVASALGKHDTLVLPSAKEVYGLVVPEALAAGLHCVVSTGAGVLASVRAMRGVYAAEPDASSLAHAMTRSAEDWSGPVPSPEILEHSPDAMAQAALKAVEVASVHV